MTRRRLAAVCVGGGVLATTVVWAGLGPGRPDPPRGKSGSGEALVLRLAAADGGTAAGELAARFARRVRELSRGSLRVAVSFQPRAAAVGALRAHEAELAIVPADSFRVLGVTSLEALQAPFLISSSTHAARATAGLIAERLQAGLGELSLSGLALVPDGLYRAFGYLKALETPGDYADVTIRAPPSVALFDLLRALGARAVPLGVEGETVVYVGFDGPATRTAEDAFPENAYTAGNLALLPKIEAIVGSTDALGRLSAGQRAIVERAAEQVRRRTIAAANERAAASAFCAAGGTVVTAPGQSLRALRARTASLLAALRRDPTTRVLVSGI
ncbi:MAG TPA: hypothetical protein VFR43_09375, partial [Gaiellaceae bacterium]|nr:hypothetical protein [Gaiellaceae bacterium]